MAALCGVDRLAQGTPYARLSRRGHARAVAVRQAYRVPTALWTNVMGMMRRTWKTGVMLGLAGVLASAAACAATAADGARTVSHGRFVDARVLAPAQPQRVVIWFRGNDAALHADAPLQALQREGALVAVVDIDAARAALAREGAGACAFGIGDVENFSRWLQAWRHLPDYRLPLLGGDGEGAALAYALAAQADAGKVAGLLTLGFRPDTALPLPVCGKAVAAGALRAVPLAWPWLAAAAAEEGAAAAGNDPALAAFQRAARLARPVRATRRGDTTPGLLAAARVLGAAPGVGTAPPPAALQGLPVVEVPAQHAGDTLAIFLSGDGGWAGLDKDVAAALAAQGVAVVGLDSLRYFWTPRTPAGVAADLERIVDHYRAQWQRPRLLLIGFSQGADVLPASINRMDPALRADVARIVLLSVGRRAAFEFHVSNWLGSSDDGLPIAPDVQRLPAERTWCVYGAQDADALCPDLPGNAVQQLRLPGDHHFNGDHARLAEVILQGLPPR